MFLTLATLLTLAAPDFTAKDMHSLKRIADPQISPDGMWVLYQQTSIDLGKSRNTDLFLVSATGGGAPRAITSNPKTDAQGRFSKDGARIAFLSTRDGASQVYVLDLNGGEARQVTPVAGRQQFPLGHRRQAGGDLGRASGLCRCGLRRLH